MGDGSMSHPIEIIRNRLYFVVTQGPMRNSENKHFFTVDDQLIYENFYADFGPLHLAKLYRYCLLLKNKLEAPSLQQKRIYHYTYQGAQQRTNAVTLITCYTIIYLGRTPEQAFRPVAGIDPPIIPYRDAGYSASTFDLHVIDVLRGVNKALLCGFLDFEHFDYEEYEHFERVENGDFNWIVPQQFLALSSPHNQHNVTGGYPMFTPEDYVPYFKSKNIQGIIRLNKKQYDRQRFLDNGFKHYELFFIDGSAPNDAIVRKFIEVCESNLPNGPLAVHCKAGLGRTGSLIGCYLMKHYRFTAQEAIAWMRICRPGSVIGPQQHFLVDQQARLWRQGDLFRRQRAEESNSVASLDRAKCENGNTSRMQTRSCKRADEDINLSLDMNSVSINPRCNQVPGLALSRDDYNNLSVVTRSSTRGFRIRSATTGAIKAEGNRENTHRTRTITQPAVRLMGNSHLSTIVSPVKGNMVRATSASHMRSITLRDDGSPAVGYGLTSRPVSQTHRGRVAIDKKIFSDPGQGERLVEAKLQRQRQQG